MRDLKRINVKIHNERNIKISSKDRLSITDFSFLSGSDGSAWHWPALFVGGATCKLQMPTGQTMGTRPLERPLGDKSPDRGSRCNVERKQARRRRAVGPR